MYYKLGDAAPRRLERDLDNRRIGGVCSGLARYFGLKVTVVRLLFLVSIFFSFSFTLWLYFVLWALLPAAPRTDAELSWRLRRKSRRLNKLVQAAYARLSLPGAREGLERTHQLIQSLLPDFDRASRRDHPELIAAKAAALEEFPALLNHYVRLPQGYAIGQRLADGKTPEARLMEQLQRLEEGFRRVTEHQFSQRFGETTDGTGSANIPCGDDELIAVQQRLETLERRLADRVDGELTSRIANIKDMLLNALARLHNRADATDPTVYNVRQIALEYLPEALEKYLGLPEDLARSEPLANGKTAHAVLAEQLDVLDHTLRKLMSSLYRDDAQGLLVHGRFLRDKFIDHPIAWSN